MTFPRPVWATALLTLLLTCGMVGVVLLSVGGDPLEFAAIGTFFTEYNRQAGDLGYDGQFAYQIAAYGADARAIALIDAPALRYQRIVYPLLARVLALGNPDIVPWTLIALNVAAHTAATALLAHLLHTWRASPSLALVYALWVGNVFSVRFDLHEPLCMVFALAALVAYQQGRWRWSIVLLMVGALTKEIALVAAAALALHAFTAGKRGWALLLLGAPLALFLTWWGVLRLWLGMFPSAEAGRIGMVLLPYAGYLAESNPLERLILGMWLVLPSALLPALALRRWWRTRTLTVTGALLLGAAAFTVWMPGGSWADPVAAYRVSVLLVPAGLLFAAQNMPRLNRYLAAWWGPSFLLALLVPAMWVK